MVAVSPKYSSTIVWGTVFVLMCCLQFRMVESALVANINTDALQSLVQEVRSKIMPGIIQFLDDTLDLSISTQVGDCCDSNDLGAKVSIALSNLRWSNNYQLNMDSIPSANSAKVVFTSNNVKIETSIASQFAVAFGVGEAQCNPVVVAALTMPQFSFNVDMVKQPTSLLDIISGESSSFRIALGNVQLQPLDLQFTVQSTGGLCNTVLDRLTAVVNQAADLLSTAATNQFRTQIAKFLNPLLDTVPIAFETPIAILNGQLDVKLGLQSFTSTGTGIQSIIGASFSSALDQPAWRQGNSYQRPLPDVPSTDFTALNSDRLVHLQLTYPPVNQLLAAVWYQVWASVATDEAVVAQTGDDFCNAVDADADPCPFPPIRSDPFTILDRILLRIGFLFQTAFKYHAVVEPPALAVVQRLVVVDNTTNTTQTVLQGRVPTKVALRGTSWLSETALEKTLAILGVEVVLETDVPGYDPVTGTIRFDGFAFRLENAVSETRLLFTELFVQAAVGFLNQFIAKRLLKPLNTGIQLALNLIPLRIPKLKNLPLRNYTTSFSLPDFLVEFGETFELSTNLDIAVQGPNGKAAVSVTADDSIALPAVPDVSAFTEDVFFYSSVYDSATGESLVVISRTTSTGTVEQYHSGAWVPL